MCAIFGVLNYISKLTAFQRHYLVKALGTAAEIRGTDATGIAYFQRDKLCIQKAPKPAHKMRYRIPTEDQYIMGHTRMSINELDAKVKTLRELRNLEAEIRSEIATIEDALKAAMLIGKTDTLIGRECTVT